MKRFCINVIIVILTAGTILSAISFYDATSLSRADWHLSPDVHIIAIGPSTTECALNEKHIPGFLNLSRSGTAMTYLVPMLPRILDENPQIDTVWLNHGRFQFKHMSDDSRKGDPTLIRHCMPLLCCDMTNPKWKELALNPYFYTILLHPIPEQIVKNISSKNIRDYGFGYNSLDRSNLYDENANWGIAWYDSVMQVRGGNRCSKEWILENCSECDYWERKAIEICQEHGVVPVLFFTPLYQYERWCTWDGFWEYMHDYDENTLIADYEDFQFPDDSYYGDVHHLNQDGAEYLTAHIAKEGVHIETLKNWLNSKRASLRQ